MADQKEIQRVFIENIDSLFSSIYNTVGTKQTNFHTVTGQATIGGGGTVVVTLTNKAIFNSSTSFVTVTGNNTAARAPQITQTSGSSITFTGTAGDVINYVMVGR